MAAALSQPSAARGAALFRLRGVLGVLGVLGPPQRGLGTRCAGASVASVSSRWHSCVFGRNSFGRAASSIAVPSSKAAAGDGKVLQAEGPLRASRTTEFSKLGGAIAAQLRDSGTASVSAMGPTATYTAVRALVAARGFVLGQKLDEELLVSLREEITDKDVRMEFDVRLAAAPEVTEVAVPVAHSTNTGQLASFVATTLVKESRTPALHFLGPLATSQALKSLLIATTFVKRDGRQKVSFAPRRSKTNTDGKKQIQLVLSCRLSAPDGSPLEKPEKPRVA